MKMLTYVINREGLLKCLLLLTWGEGGVKNSLNCAYVIYGQSLSEESLKMWGSVASLQGFLSKEAHLKHLKIVQNQKLWYF